MDKNSINWKMELLKQDSLIDMQMNKIPKTKKKQKKKNSLKELVKLRGKINYLKNK